MKAVSLLGLLAILVACSTANETTASNVDALCGASGSATCGGGTQCLARSHWLGDGSAGCTAATTTCSIVCTKDADCTALGASLRCIKGCNLGASTCGDPSK